MTVAAQNRTEDQTSPVLGDLSALAAEALAAAETLLDAARAGLRSRIGVDARGRISGAALEAEQHAAHGFAWLAVYVEGLRRMIGWRERLKAEGRGGELEELIFQAALGQIAAEISGGIPMSQGETARLADFGLSDADEVAFTQNAAVRRLARAGDVDAVRRRIMDLVFAAQGAATFGDCALESDFDMIRDQFRRFADERVIPHAHGWHLRDELIPMEIVQEAAELGVFGLTIPEEFGGSGLGKTAMCVVSEELSRGYIGVGSLGTRSEIAAELILGGGTAEQKAEWLPKLASGEILPTAVFTEPNTGSDLGSLSTRAVKEGEDYVVSGAKTWITHAARADLMTLLVRTDPSTKDYRGLSMLLAPKLRGTEEAPFPTPGMTGGEIEVLGYRGMKEYEIGFDKFRVPAANLLGGEEGQGFKQLMQTFESARIQTAARAVGVAQSALEIGMRYAQERKQFGQALAAFPRVYGKLARMVVEIMIARQLSYYAAQEKDEGRRCDLEAGLAKLFGARVAWASADNSLQIHGGNGFALEYPISRVLCDARILNIFEGAAEIQAGVIARRLLETGAN